MLEKIQQSSKLRKSSKIVEKKETPLENPSDSRVCCCNEGRADEKPSKVDIDGLFLKITPTSPQGGRQKRTDCFKGAYIPIDVLYSAVSTLQIVPAIDFYDFRSSFSFRAREQLLYRCLWFDFDLHHLRKG